MVDKDNKVRFMAWKTKNLKIIKIPEVVTESTEIIPPGTLTQMKFVGKSDYI